LNSGGFAPHSHHHEYHHPHPHHSLGVPSLNCISIAQHIDTCPICSRLYDTDKTLYILAIIGLLILCFLMARRIVKL
jgi:ABC-type nickel/cobalt efflux system permease component RcnA